MSFVPRPYQPAAIDWISHRRRGLVKAKAGSGKTLIAAAAIAKVYDMLPRSSAKPVRIAWIANTLEQVQQAHAALDQFPMPHATRMVACAQGQPDVSHADVLIVDECHHALSPLWRSIIDTALGAVWFFTATPCEDDPEKHAALLELAGGFMFTVDPEAIAKTLAHGRVLLLDDTDDGLEQPINEAIAEELDRLVSRMLYFKKEAVWQAVRVAFCHHFKIDAHPDQMWDAVRRRGLYQKAMNWIAGEVRKELWPRVAYRFCQDLGIAKNEARNAAVVRAALEHPAATKLVLVNNKEHGALLAERIHGAVVAHSKMGVRRRREAMAALIDGSLKCMVATSLADEGFDCPRASVLIMACGGKAAGRVEQRTGRVLRAFQGKEEGLIYDFTDEGHPLLANQSRKRQAVYRELGYMVEERTAQLSLI